VSIINSAKLSTHSAKAIISLATSLFVNDLPQACYAADSLTNQNPPNLTLPKLTEHLTLKEFFSSEQNRIFYRLVEQYQIIENEALVFTYANYLNSTISNRNYFATITNNSQTGLIQIATNEVERTSSRMVAFQLLTDIKSPELELAARTLLMSDKTPAELSSQAINVILSSYSKDHDKTPILKTINTCHNVYIDQIIREVSILGYSELDPNKNLWANVLEAAIAKKSLSTITRLELLDEFVKAVASGDIQREALNKPISSIENDTNLIFTPKIIFQLELAKHFASPTNNIAPTWIDNQENRLLLVEHIKRLRDSDLIPPNHFSATLDSMLKKISMNYDSSNSVLTNVLSQFAREPNALKSSVSSILAQSHADTAMIDFWTELLKWAKDNPNTLPVNRIVHKLTAIGFLKDRNSGGLLELIADKGYIGLVEALIPLTKALKPADVLENSLAKKTILALGGAARNGTSDEKSLARKTILSLLNECQKAKQSDAINICITALQDINNNESIQVVLEYANRDLHYTAVAICLAKNDHPEAPNLATRALLDQKLLQFKDISEKEFVLLIRQSYKLNPQICSLLLQAYLQMHSWSDKNALAQTLDFIWEKNIIEAKKILFSRLEVDLKGPLVSNSLYAQTCTKFLFDPEIAIRFYNYIKSHRAISYDFEKFFNDNISTKAAIENFCIGLSNTSLFFKPDSIEAKELQNASKIYRQLLENGILHPFRYTIPTLEYALECTKPEVLKKADKLVIIFTAYGGSPVFRLNEKIIQSFRDAGYVILLFESSGLYQSNNQINGAYCFDSIIKKAQQLLEITPQKTAQIGLYIAHSNSRMMQFGEGKSKTDYDNSFIAVDDYQLIKNLGFNTLFENNCNISLIGCLTDEDNSIRLWRKASDANKNIKTVFRAIIPQAASLDAHNISINQAIPVFDQSKRFVRFDFQ
jgi:hypothetical protein